MRILVVGAGATGGYFGGRLARAGRDVTFLVRAGRAQLLERRGLRITGLDEETVLRPRVIRAGDIDAPYDVVLLAVKATGLERAVDDMAAAVGPHSLVVPVLNGVRHVDVLAARFGDQAVLGGVSKVATTLDAQGDIVRPCRTCATELAATPPRRGWTRCTACSAVPGSRQACPATSTRRCGPSGFSSPLSAR
ncbi:2-dehydropantoate 2-reductase N-terminal domain-containing protein [Streptomyces sp. NPDC007896]|uniref:2-dehydropantoate 2-reductase N-terminal domain-containing protein n=1 Tax=Streptomyces sp. NPDC007896 TaxID=3364784 RepID=UPI0036E097C8